MFKQTGAFEEIIVLEVTEPHKPKENGVKNSTKHEKRKGT
jgi:hypothetical protein